MVCNPRPNLTTALIMGVGYELARAVTRENDLKGPPEDRTPQIDAHRPGYTGYRKAPVEKAEGRAAQRRLRQMRRNQE